MKNEVSKKSKKYSLLNKKNLIKVIAIIAVYFILAYLANGDILNRQYKSLIVPMGINIILAVSLNLTTGFLGELSLGQNLSVRSNVSFIMHLQIPLFYLHYMNHLVLYVLKRCQWQNQL